MESAFKVGTYIVPLQNKLLSRAEPLTAYKPYMIIEYLHVPYILTDSGKCNFCAYYGKEEVERVEGIRWFATLKEAQTFCNQHIFEIGKYYSFNKEEGFFSDLVAEVLKLLKMDDAGRVSKFFKKEVKRLKEEIKTFEMNKQTAEMEFERRLSKYDSQIEDAEEAVKEAYTKIQVEELTSNEAMENFSAKYWSNINDKEYLLKSLVDARKRAVEQYEITVKERDEKIAKRVQRIEKISKKSV